MDETIAWVIIVCGLMGSLIALLMRVGAADAFSHTLASRAKDARSSLSLRLMENCLRLLQHERLWTESEGFCGNFSEQDQQLQAGKQALTELLNN